MEKAPSKVKAVIVSVLWALLILIFYSVGGAAVSITKADNTHAMLIQGACVWLAVLTALIYIWRSKHSFNEMGFRGAESGSGKKALYYIPAIILEIGGFAVGFRKLSLAYVLAVVFCTVAVGFAEEIYFRSIILNRLKAFGVKKAIIISSVIFGIAHLGNIMGGQNVYITLIQVAFAFIMGIVFAEIYVLSQSLIPVILWHFIHDCFGNIQSDSITGFTFAVLIAEVVIALAYVIFLWRQLKGRLPETC